jgi:predicted metal-binding membrane protein
VVEAPRPVRRALSDPVVNSRRVFLGISAIVFAASAAMTIVGCASMSAMGAMQMPGGWAMSMMWMRMPGQTWLGAAASFVGMWVVMMVAMMLPSLTPLLWRYREAMAKAGGAHVGWLTALVGVGYFVVWAVFGVIVFPLGVALAATVMREPAAARAVPIVVGAAVLIAGVLQHTEWKARHLAFCREAPDRCLTFSVDGGTAWRHGVRLGVHCSHSCVGLTAVVLGLGVMDLRVMAVVAAAITAEHLAPAGVRVARAIGAVGVGAGVFLIARAAGLG